MSAGNARIWTGNARVHLFARRALARLTASLRAEQAEAAKLDAFIFNNLKELGYGE